jgi:hypothetical protein
VERDLERRHGDALVDPRPECADVGSVAAAQRQGVPNPVFPIDVGCAAKHVVVRQQIADPALVASVHGIRQGLFSRSNLAFIVRCTGPRLGERRTQNAHDEYQNQRAPHHQAPSDTRGLGDCSTMTHLTPFECTAVMTVGSIITSLFR